MAMSKDEILNELRRFVSSNDGLIPGERTFRSATRIKQSAWKGRYWARWTDAVREAGYDPNTLTERIPDETMLLELASFVTDLGRFPVRDEINIAARQRPAVPVWTTVKRRYGGMPELAKALLELSRNRSQDSGEAVRRTRSGGGPQARFENHSQKSKVNSNGFCLPEILSIR